MKPKLYFLTLALISAATVLGQGVGTLDSTFGQNGIVTTAIGNSENRANNMVLQPDGKTILAGAYINDSTGNYDIAVSRYQINGSLDSGFGINGIIRQPVGPENDGAIGVVLQADQKIVIAGNTANANGSYTKWMLVRYTAAGTIDSTYGTNGLTITDFGTSSSVNGVALQSDGKVIAVGGAFVVRYKTDGTLDSNFGYNGIVTNVDGRIVQCVVVKADGKIIVGGAAQRPSSSYSFDFSVFQYLANGTPDSSFGTNGIGRISMGNWGEHVAAMTIDSNGKIVAVGSVLLNSDNDVAIARFNSDGSIDNTFSNRTITLSIGNEDAYGVVIQPDGKIVVATLHQIYNVGTSNIVLMRFKSNGSNDSTFGTFGHVETIIPQSDFVNGMVRQPDGKIVLGGFIWNQTQEYFLAVRYNMEKPAPASVPTLLSETNISVYPNPAQEHLFIDAQQLQQSYKYEFQMTNIMGKIMLRGQINTGVTNEVKISDLSPGIYLLQFWNSAGCVTQKIIKQ